MHLENLTFDESIFLNYGSIIEEGTITIISSKCYKCFVFIF